MGATFDRDTLEVTRNAIRLIKQLRAERDRARDIAVALEQEVADLRERLEFATWGMS